MGYFVEQLGHRMKYKLAFRNERQSEVAFLPHTVSFHWKCFLSNVNGYRWTTSKWVYNLVTIFSNTSWSGKVDFSYIL